MNLWRMVLFATLKGNFLSLFYLYTRVDVRDSILEETQPLDLKCCGLLRKLRTAMFMATARKLYTTRI